jgi:diguanylate cyclase (GGDEF)-like protein
VLVAVAGVLQDELRDTDEAFRPGGDEFVVVLPHADVEHATAVAHRLRQAVEGLVVQPASSAASLRVTATLGVAAVANGSPDDGSSPGDAVLRAANEALHCAKAKGKNRVQRG